MRQPVNALFTRTRDQARRIKERRPELRNHMVVTSNGGGWRNVIGMQIDHVVESDDAIRGFEWRTTKLWLEHAQRNSLNPTWTVITTEEE